MFLFIKVNAYIFENPCKCKRLHYRDPPRNVSAYIIETHPEM
jgi:hypothetical protein